MVESKLCFNRRLGHDVRYGLVDRVSYIRVPSPMIWRSDKAAARWGLSRSGRLSTATGFLFLNLSSFCLAQLSLASLSLSDMAELT